MFAGISSVMFLSWRKSPVTAPEVHLISGQSHGDDEEFQDWMDGGSPHCCLSLRRIDWSESVDCEITLKGKERRMEKKTGRSILAISCG